MMYGSDVGGEVADLFFEVELLVAHAVADFHLHDHSLLSYHRVHDDH